MQISDDIDFFAMFNTQSRNASAKIALAIDDFYINYYEKTFDAKFDWDTLDDNIYVNLEGFGFHESSFTFQMFKKLIDRLIDTGVMYHLAEKFYSSKQKFLQVYYTPKVLCLDDLSFAFFIWLMFCLVSSVAFVGEFIIKAIQKLRNRQIYSI